MIRWMNRALVARCTDMCNRWPHIKNAFILIPLLAPPEPDDKIPAFLKNVPLETLMKAIGDRKEPTTYQGVVYEHDDILGDTWLNDANAIFVPLYENNLRCHTCGTTVAKDMLMDHTCPVSFKLKRGAATETMTLSEDDHLRRLNHNLAREELESIESDKFLTATTHTKSHARRRAKSNSNCSRLLLKTRKNLVNMRRSWPMTNGMVDWFRSCSKF